jgi:Kef-type K+ transport system membrane component KefB
MEFLKGLSPELGYVVLLFALFILPRVLQRYRIPTAITALALGAFLALGFGLFSHDPTVELLSTFGIVSLFLFAGLEVDVRELRKHAIPLVLHLVLRLATLFAVAWGLVRLLGLEPRAAALVALALLTPSTGFILDSLHAFGLNEKEQFWVRSKAIATELVALLVLFGTVQSTTVMKMSVSVVVLVLLIAVLPLVFHWFAKRVVPWAPKSEFAFLIMIAVVCAIVTRELGVYYLVGAFVVGMAAQSFREHLPAMASDKMLHAVEAFASIFVPFYFFHAGLLLQARDFAPAALFAGLAFLVFGLPLRMMLLALHGKLTRGQGLKDSMRISVPLMPTLVFTLVIVQILRDQFVLPPWILGGLIVYTLVNTLIPGLVLKAPPPVFDSPHALWRHPLARATAAALPAAIEPAEQATSATDADE